MTASREPGQPGRPGPATILVVDDDLVLLEVYRDALTVAGYQVLTADTGGAALLQLLVEDVDLLILDVMLPGIGGFEVAVGSRQRPATSRIPILFVSGITDPLRKAQARAFGGDDWLAKPFALEDLLQRVARLLPPAARPGASDS